MARSSSYRNLKPLDGEALERLAIGYVGRYATTRAKLAAYLHRKLGERGWEGPADAPEGGASAHIDAIVARFADVGYVDDRGFAEARAASYARRGYGARRLNERLRADGIAEDDAATARAAADENAWAAALAFAQKRRIGPFSRSATDIDMRRRALGAMLRAGHSMDVARRIINAMPGEIPEERD
ncbi:regulatory protein RecX [Sphingomonas sp. KC8]|uniref:regulatory protein RecX n=1 Tax=Sphingomonas sp. KC8 TaxID=1030157 RepID=UPI000248A44C|nr:RecX family transcriptional regulator [Sphingomonas sp. KC8]ARS27063.1 RecX family transcriptional regulator [Sphingomonas sp. KC8]